jgi:hypothetical protein
MKGASEIGGLEAQKNNIIAASYIYCSLISGA